MDLDPAPEPTKIALSIGLLLDTKRPHASGTERLRKAPSSTRS